MTIKLLQRHQLSLITFPVPIIYLSKVAELFSPQSLFKTYAVTIWTEPLSTISGGHYQGDVDTAVEAPKSRVFDRHLGEESWENSVEKGLVFEAFNRIQ